MPRGLKLWLGIPMVLLGIFVTLAGVAAMAVFGLDGAFRIRSGVDTPAHAVVFDGLSLRGLPQGGLWSAALAIAVDADEGEAPIFVGVGPRERVASYLAGAEVDRIVQLRPVGGIRTERAEDPSTPREPGPPGAEPFWVASAEGDPASLRWTATSGEWSVVVMRADGERDLHGEGELSLEMDAVVPLAIGLLVAGVLLLGGGGALIVSGSKATSTRSPSATARPDPTTVGEPDR